MAFVFFGIRRDNLIHRLRRSPFPRGEGFPKSEASPERAYLPTGLTHFIRVARGRFFPFGDTSSTVFYGPPSPEGKAGEYLLRHQLCRFYFSNAYPFDIYTENSCTCQQIFLQKNPTSQQTLTSGKFRIPNSELYIKHSAYRIPNSELDITHSELRIPHSELRIPH